ncbi:phosphoribosylformylglycinamidine cyclo-ligase [Kiritimatiellota bacterium B12222]|nr:phosphoribosylformylglycinamidine cyclo-ligase [Kiritimatiellota bacterium B12222]
MKKQNLSYKDAGVDTEKAAELVGDIGGMRNRTETKHKLMQSFGLFAASFDLSPWKEPVIQVACDGVGTKIQLLMKHDMPEVAGVDLVGMNVNDVLTSNAMPVLFLDYVGINNIESAPIGRMIDGLTKALADCDCVLAGGETAEMPGLVHEDIMELSGFVVGVSEKSDILNPEEIEVGDIVLGIPSNGIHANGFSLVRKLMENDPELIPNELIADLLAPTRVYYPEVKAMQDAGIRPRGMAHITGGGIRENFARILNKKGAELTLPEWKNPAARRLVDAIPLENAIHAFNMGIGWMIVVSPEQLEATKATLPEAIELGTITADETINVAVPWA